MITRKRNSHCSYCGEPFMPGGFPKTCERCKITSWQPPIPVVIVLAPIGGQLIGIVRGIEPHIGKPALPGGYVDPGESFRQAGKRELWEETAIDLPVEQFTIIDERSSSSGQHSLVFVRSPEVLAWKHLTKPFVPNAEVLERIILDGSEELAYDHHTQVMRAFLSGRL